MGQKRWALSLPLDGFTLAEHGEIAREAERLGYTDAWSLEVDGVDCFSPLAVAALTTRLRVGTAIANAYTRGPATLAMCAAGLAEIAPGRVCLGGGTRPGGDRDHRAVVRLRRSTDTGSRPRRAAVSQRVPECPGLQGVPGVARARRAPRADVAGLEQRRSQGSRGCCPRTGGERPD